MLFAEEVARLVSKAAKVNTADALNLLEEPPSPELGDVAFPCFGLAKEWKKSPARIAQQLAQDIKPELPVATAIATGPYVNFYLNKAVVAEEALTKRRKLPKRKERVMVEHSNGNTHKEAHIGHLRNLFLGDSIVRVMRAAGFPVVNTYYINDTGAHVAKCLWALKRYHADEEPPKDKLRWLGGIYAEGARTAQEDEEAKKEADEVLRKLEEGDKETLELWKKTRQWSIDDWHRIFEQLEMLPFDARFFDSDVTPAVKPIVDRMHEKGILKESEGALVADLEHEGLHTAIIRKRDGTTPYLAKDLALAERKFKDYEIDRNIYVVGSEQELHFQQLFKLLEKDGFPQAKKCHHVSYGLVMLKEGKMSSREGTAIPFDEFYDKVYERAKEGVAERHEDWPEKKQEASAKGITLGAMKLPLVLQEPKKRIIFDLEKAMDFEGETGPYLQYTHARLCSILRKHGKKVTENIDYSILESQEEQAVIKRLGKETDALLEAAEKHKPSLLARYAIDLAQEANTFYHTHQILQEAEAVKKARLLLVLKTKEALGRVLESLGIPALEEM